jgi:competence protein ComEC
LKTAPLLFYGLCFLLGIASQILFHPLYIAILVLLIALMRSRLISGLTIFSIGFVFATLSVTLPTLPEEGVEGQGTFIPDSVSYGHSPFGTSFITKGSLYFTTATATYKRVPCQIYTPLHKPRPSSSYKLHVQGKLLPKTFPNYVLKPSHIETGRFISLAEWRFQIKDRIRHQFAKLFSSPTTASFLLSMVTGEIDDRLMSLQFNRIGLLHLLGISGFQFSLLALLLGTLLRATTSSKRAPLLLIAILSVYAFILGNSPPIQRAWASVTLYAVARLKGFQPSPLNFLGAALLWQLFLDPCVFFHLGFQFSFLCTAAIFIVYPPLRSLFTRWLPTRSFQQVRSLSPLNRTCHTLTFLCREAVALNFAIHLVSLPLIFFHFHKFPFLSLAYNIFLPPIVSLAYLFLIPGLCLEPFAHFLAVPFLKIAEFLTNSVLAVAASPPALFDFQWRMPHFTLSWALASLALLWILFHERSRLLDHFRRR